MHKSCLGAIVIDCRTEDLTAASAFWSAALGYPARATDDARYIDLAVAEGQPGIIVQQVDHDSRVHLDLETDDIDAEVARLEALGAKRVAQIKTWVGDGSADGAALLRDPPATRGLRGQGDGQAGLARRDRSSASRAPMSWLPPRQHWWRSCHHRAPTGHRGHAPQTMVKPGSARPPSRRS